MFACLFRCYIVLFFYVAYMFTASISSQKFTSLEILLCPPESDKNETVDFSLSTRSSSLSGLQVALNNVSFILQ